MDGLMTDSKSSTDMKDARAAFDRCKSAFEHNHKMGLEDLRFSRLGDQWPEAVKKARERDGRPCLTINRQPAFMRQVVNDARQNKPTIRVMPVGSGSDKKTAEILNGLIRNIEYTSNADVAYDTAIEAAVSSGFGYFRINLDYAFEDAFDLDIMIERMANAFAVYPDPHSSAADSSDWNEAFIIDKMSKAEFKRKYKGKAESDFDSAEWSGVSEPWLDEDSVMVAEWWTREQVDKAIILLSNGSVMDKAALEADMELQTLIQSGVINIEKERVAPSHRVTQRIISGIEVLETNEWPGRFIPIVPVYGDEFDVEGKRYLRSLIHHAKDAQRMFNYWRSTSTELVALAPRVPFIGPKGAFNTDAARWGTANTTSHSYLEYDGNTPPQRQPLDSGSAAGALQEAMNAADDMKASIGLYDASLGARSNETSGKAIMARQREGDVATFHFIDNLNRAIRHAGRILIDLIPKVYDTPRVLRVIGEDGTEKNEPVNQQVPEVDDQGQPVVDGDGAAIMAMRDLTTGKYDLVVKSGPSFTSRREEAATQMTELVRVFPQAAPYVADLMAKNFDWPGADEIAKRFEAMNPMKQDKGIPPELQKQMQQMQAEIQKLQVENQGMKQDASIEMKRVENANDVANRKLDLDFDLKQREMAMKLQFEAEPAF
jgi:hypothetical protein